MKYNTNTVEASGSGGRFGIEILTRHIRLITKVIKEMLIKI